MLEFLKVGYASGQATLIDVWVVGIAQCLTTLLGGFQRPELRVRVENSLATVLDAVPYCELRLIFHGT